MAYRLKTFQVQFVAEPPEFPRGSYCRSSEDVAIVARGIYRTLDADKEHFLLLTLNNKNRVNGFKVVSTGSLTASLVHPREVWRAALHLCAAAVIFVHNHPSGEPAPSPEDQDITRRLKETGDVLGIRVLDHVVLGDSERFFSFSDKGLL
ncbi:MAG TPA: JAB domain-containing protein [Candidatus Binatia bacterium]|jgi:DNA repair protein RadC